MWPYNNAQSLSTYCWSCWFWPIHQCYKADFSLLQKAMRLWGQCFQVVFFVFLSNLNKLIVILVVLFSKHPSSHRISLSELSKLIKTLLPKSSTKFVSLRIFGQLGLISYLLRLSKKCTLSPLCNTDQTQIAVILTHSPTCQDHSQ